MELQKINQRKTNLTYVVLGLLFCWFSILSFGIAFSSFQEYHDFYIAIDSIPQQKNSFFSFSVMLVILGLGFSLFSICLVVLVFIRKSKVLTINLAGKKEKTLWQKRVLILIFLVGLGAITLIFINQYQYVWSLRGIKSLTSQANIKYFAKKLKGNQHQVGLLTQLGTHYQEQKGSGLTLDFLAPGFIAIVTIYSLALFYFYNKITAPFNPGNKISFNFYSSFIKKGAIGKKNQNQRANFALIWFGLSICCLNVIIIILLIANIYLKSKYFTFVTHKFIISNLFGNTKLPFAFYQTVSRPHPFLYLVLFQEPCLLLLVNLVAFYLTYHQILREQGQKNAWYSKSYWVFIISCFLLGINFFETCFLCSDMITKGNQNKILHPFTKNKKNFILSQEKSVFLLLLEIIFLIGVNSLCGPQKNNLSKKPML